jgi:multiple sugar transport system ATP-binding protein
MKIRLDKIAKRFVSLRGRIDALRDIRLEIADREFFVLLGPSGCGKSTLLNLIAGLERPNSGDIWFDSKLVSSAEKDTFVAPKKRNVAMVFQSYALYPHMNVYDNIAFPLRIAKERKKQIDSAVEDAAAMLRVTELLKAKPSELSGGQRQRVAIARAIVRRPDIFLLDEPLSNLDAQLRLTMRTELKNLQRSLKITTVYVTHDQTEAMTLGDRVAVLNDGAIEQIGTPEKLYSEPANDFVAKFVGSPPMNLLKGVISRQEDRVFLDLDDKRLEIPHDQESSLTGLQVGKYIIGIRPEHISIAAHETGFTIKTEIDAVEHLGRETILHLKVGQQRLIALVAGADKEDSRFSSGKSLYVELDFNKIHIFRGGQTK